MRPEMVGPSVASKSSPKVDGLRRVPPGTEDIYKIYAESFSGEEHLRQIEAEAQAIVSEALSSPVA